MAANVLQKSVESLLKQQIANRYGKLAKSKNLSNLKQAMLDKADTVKLFDEYATKFPDIFTKDLQSAEDDLRKAHAAWYKNITIEDKLKDLADRGYVPENINTEPKKIKTQAKLLQLNDDVQDLLKKYEFTDERYLSQENQAYIDDMQRHIDNSSELSKAEKEKLTKRLYTNKSYEKSGEYDKNTKTFEKRSKDINRLTTQFLKDIENNTKPTEQAPDFNTFYKLLKDKLYKPSTVKEYDIINNEPILNNYIPSTNAGSLSNKVKKNLENKGIESFRKNVEKSKLQKALEEQAANNQAEVIRPDLKFAKITKNGYYVPEGDFLNKHNVRNWKGISHTNIKDLLELNPKNRTNTEQIILNKFADDLAPKDQYGRKIRRYFPNNRAYYDDVRHINQHRPEIVDAFENEFGDVTYESKPKVTGEPSSEYVDNLDDFGNEKGYTKKQGNNKTTIEYDEPYEGRNKPVITNEQHGYTPKYTNRDIESYINILKNPVRSEKQVDILQKLRDIIKYNEYPLTSQQIEQIKRSDLLEQMYSNLWDLWRDRKFIDVE